MTKIKSFNDLSDEERSEVVSKMIYLTGHLQICIELIDSLENFPIIWKHRLKQTGRPFLKAAEDSTTEILTQFTDEDTLMDELGNPIVSNEHVQDQAWELIKQIKELNVIAIKNLTKCNL